MIENGHPFDQIKHYTLAQARAFTEAAAGAYRRRLAAEVLNMRAAQYEKSDFASYLKRLTG